MKTEIQDTELYKRFKKALGIGTEMRIDDNPFIVECCQIAKDFSSNAMLAVSLPSDEEIDKILLKEWKTSSFPKTKEEKDIFYIGFHKGQDWMRKEVIKRARQ